jgi:hypothetical protein
MAFVPFRGSLPLQPLQQAVELARAAIGRVPGAGLEVPQPSLDKLRWLQNSGRDFREVNEVLLDEMGAAFTQALFRVMRKQADVGAPWRAAAEAYRDRVATRLATSGGDVRAHMKPLAPSTIRRKGHARIGVDTGALLRDMAVAKVRNTR